MLLKMCKRGAAIARACFAKAYWEKVDDLTSGCAEGHGCRGPRRHRSSAGRACPNGHTRRRQLHQESLIRQRPSCRLVGHPRIAQRVQSNCGRLFQQRLRIHPNHISETELNPSSYFLVHAQATVRRLRRQFAQGAEGCDMPGSAFKPHSVRQSQSHGSKKCRRSE